MAWLDQVMDPEVPVVSVVGLAKQLSPTIEAGVAALGAPKAVIGIAIALLVLFGKPLHAGGVALVLVAQIAAMRVLFRDPKGKAPWYNGTGVVLYVTGMMISAFALRGLA